MAFTVIKNIGMILSGDIENPVLKGDTIVIADGGLDGTGRAVAAALLTRAQGIVLCPAERLGEYIRA